MEFYTNIHFFKSINELFSEVKKNTKKNIKIIDTNIAYFYPHIVDDNTLILNSGENYKDINSICKIIDFALSRGLTRHDAFIGIGGGVITDMTAFAASIYKRGAKLHLIPTTLLAMVDAAIGGKTGCDFGNSKNMIGTFFPSHHLYITSEFIQTLPQNEYLSGLAEVIKTALLYDKELFELLENNTEQILNKDKNIIDIMIQKCSNAKCNVVKEDLTEQGIRKQLNLGHTFGHALESLCGLGSITHGEAVAWGIARSYQLSNNLNYCASSIKDRIFTILQNYGFVVSTKHPKLPSNKNSLDFIKEMHQDKKNFAEEITIILQNNICSTKILQINEKDLQSVLD